MAETYRGGPDITSVVSAYGEGKRVAELLFRASGRDLRIARLFSVIGPYQDLNSSFAVPAPDSAGDSAARPPTAGSTAPLAEATATRAT